MLSRVKQRDNLGAKPGRYDCGRMRLLALLLLGSPILALAQDTRLDAIREILLPMRQLEPLTARGATPAFTTVKHQLRDWIESRLSVLDWSGDRWNPDPVVLQDQLNEDLHRADLLCDSTSEARCPDWSQLGFLGRVRFEMKSGLLVVQTAVGIQECGFDESAYIYESAGGQWHELWQSEQNDYDAGKYLPQRLEDVLISPADFRPGADKTEHMVLTIGREPWCSSNWHDVYYRVWQVKSAFIHPVLLLNGSQWAFVNSPIKGSVSQTDVFIQYEVNGIEGGFTRPEIRHYLLKNGQLERVDPVALSPTDFVAFWLRTDWTERSRWTEQASRVNLKQRALTHTGRLEEIGFPSRHCTLHPDLWQQATAEDGQAKKQVYFLIRWRPPYRFTMMDARDHPWPDCTAEDREADEPRSLFVAQ
jgi:hypothetical protein